MYSLSIYLSSIIYLSVMCLYIDQLSSIHHLFISLSFIHRALFEHLSSYPVSQQYFKSSCMFAHVLRLIFLVFMPNCQISVVPQVLFLRKDTEGVSGSWSSFQLCEHVWERDCSQAGGRWAGFWEKVGVAAKRKHPLLTKLGTHSPFQVQTLMLLSQRFSLYN